MKRGIIIFDDIGVIEQREPLSVSSTFEFHITRLSMSPHSSNTFRDCSLYINDVEYKASDTVIIKCSDLKRKNTIKFCDRGKVIKCEGLSYDGSVITPDGIDCVSAVVQLYNGVMALSKEVSHISKLVMEHDKQIGNGSLF